MMSARTSANTIPPKLEQAWLVQLAHEYARICQERKVRLKPPILRLTQAESRLGHWSGAKREISLSSSFIAGHEWAVVLQVFKHEMAHQLCGELWHEPNAAHGPSFVRACQILGVDAPFQGARVDLTDGLFEALHQSQKASPADRLHQRIRKLLALAASDNEHEAALALAHASTLLTRHRLEASTLGGQTDFIHESINTGQQTMPGFRRAICSIILDYFSVRVITASIYDQHRNVQVKTVELLGRRQDVAVARHCYHFLEERLQALWQARCHRFKGMGKMPRNSFCLGLLAGFRQTLAQEEQKKKHESASPQIQETMQSLMQSEVLLNTFVGERFPRVRRQRQQGITVSPRLYDAAMEEGRKLRMSQPMGATSAPVPALPGPMRTRKK
ncbi:MAG: SprT family zinc-dependent metalloprotease [Desulfobulbaceae bacterium]|nr:SprT family zinc-dependent metalloprotease [Desulfobulbaceae bacterium]